MSKSVIIDNASLVYLSRLRVTNNGIFHILRNLFNVIHFPTAVVSEYSAGIGREPERKWILNRLHPDQGFYRFCNAYDSIVMAMVENHKGIDKGEAEAYAQLRKVNAHLIISDDKSFTYALKKIDSSIRVYSTLHLICWLDILRLLLNWNEIVTRLHEVRPFSSQDIRVAYLEIIEHLGLEVNKKMVSRKCSLSKILPKKQRSK